MCIPNLWRSIGTHNSKRYEEMHRGNAQLTSPNEGGQNRTIHRIGNIHKLVNIIGETGASCYNFQSKSIFHKNMHARDFLYTWSCHVTSLLSQIRRISLLYHVTKKLSVISHESSTVTTSPIYGASCYSMGGNILQRHVLPLLVLHTHILWIVVILSSCRLPILFRTHSWTIHN